MFAPQSSPGSKPETPSGPLGTPLLLPVVALLALVAFWLSLTRIPTNRPLGYALATLVLFGSVATMAACGGGSSSTPPPPPTPTSHTASITAVYSGDATYKGSTSAAATITIQ
jgi:hypothetical protein